MREKSVPGRGEQGTGALRRKDNEDVRGPGISSRPLEWNDQGRMVVAKIPEIIGTQVTESLVGWGKDFSIPARGEGSHGGLMAAA